MPKDIKHILQRVESGRYSQEDEAIAKLWLFKLRNTDVEEITEAELDEISVLIWQRLSDSVLINKDRSFFWKRCISAVAAVLLITFGLYFFYQHSYLAFDPSLPSENDLPAGVQGATLTLTDGNQINLSDSDYGRVAEESGVRIMKMANGQLTYELSKEVADVELENTLSTSNGQTFQVRLPDGSKVWLNAGSSISYVPTLTNQGKRKVKLTGEAYFEVAKDRSRPFVVETKSQQVEVLGTSFNINAYSNEPLTRTTLVEGSIQVKVGQRSFIVEPGKQLINDGTAIDIVDTDVERDADWKEGDFYFNNVDFKVAMRKIERWYDVEMVYDVSVPDGIQGGGWIARDKPLSQVLKSMERSGIAKFKIEGRRVHVIR